MKTMNYLFTAAFLFLLGACTNEAPTQDLEATEYKSRWEKQKEEAQEQEKEEPQEMYESDILQFHLLGKLNKLDRKKKDLEEEIEGGNKELIPSWESVTKEFDLTMLQINDSRKEACMILQFRKFFIEKQAQEGDPEAKKELEKINKGLENCGRKTISIVEVFDFPSFIRTEPETGGCQEPGPEFESCKMPIGEGTTVVIAKEGIESLILTTEMGVYKAEYFGKSEIQGFSKYLIDVPSFESGRISVSNGKEVYGVNVEISLDF